MFNLKNENSILHYFQGKNGYNEDVYFYVVVEQDHITGNFNNDSLRYIRYAFLVQSPI